MPNPPTLLNPDQAHNLNVLWAELLIEECLRWGIRDFCIAPGSRSTPLTVAVARHPKANAHCHFDERGLGFFALGMAKTQQRCVALITTSGTAVANLYPAVIEARQTGVPLLLLTGDRPAELLDSGANQAIIQQRIFADYPVFQAVLPEPTTAISPAMLLGSVDNALAAQQQSPGPVHFNCPFREPFYPEQNQQHLADYLAPLANWLSTDQPYTRYPQSGVQIATEARWLDWQQRKGLVVVGQQTPAQARAILAWAEQLGWPVVADVQSQLQGLPGVISQAELLVRQPDTAKALEPELIVQFGGFLVGKRLQNWLASSDAEYWYVDVLKLRHDPSHRLQQRWVCRASEWLTAHPASTQHRDYAKLWRAVSNKVQPLIDAALREDSELSACAALAMSLPAASQLFIGNSMLVRLFEALGCDISAAEVQCNRGASGIDGLIASAAGQAAASGQSTTLIIGDTSALHDLNSLALAKRYRLNVLVVNNDGGEIFKLLPGLNDPQLAQDYYQMPHQLDFSAAAQQFKLAYRHSQTLAEFSRDYQQLLDDGQGGVIELSFAPGDASRRYLELGKSIDEQLAL
ncbi:2-succinyl-5-enolpyruvyl-6-hydroxy-3-cyclohexene-1-carboxylic-acid synthase [Aliagarivorans taiwanensis]|uniref:2-succinyl-5-enolpyruvyl-6-hydroxy-3- cyclohexene-1-carboxylic-acid synthase n=1 Tax=Aliagarivorans taiwanensis TaxID=561966 RepID=UPI0003F53718|nr:2-succinyl-5-enolpyruvyl-6-hydroxy-3-cyclohexene-1-carboxylic-acid synthase [Aliagarivorans taiwanensis]